MLRKVSAVIALFASATSTQAQVLNGATGSSAYSVDSYKVNCPAGTVGARALIQDVDPFFDGVRLGVQVVKIANNTYLAAASATAPDIALHIADLAGGVANYHALVSKSGGSGVEPYQIDLYCYNGANARIGPNAVLYQNQ